jgi:transposase-like protein
MTVKGLKKKFPEEKDAIDYFIKKRYNGVVTCPHCGSTEHYRYDNRPKVFYCKSCKNTFSPFKFTAFWKTHIDLRDWFYLINKLLNGRMGSSGCEVARELEVTYVTAFRMLKQIRIAMGNKEILKEFEAIVEVDETYVGGKPRKGNAILDKDGNVIKSGNLPPQKRGRGTKKIPVVGVKERSTGKVYARVMLPNEEGQKLTGRQLVELIEKAVKDGTIVMTDDFSSYKLLDKSEYNKRFFHLTINHSKGQYYDNGVHTNGIENFWSVFKKGIFGVYFHMSKKYLQKYVDEFSFRQNTRKSADLGFEQLIDQCVDHYGFRNESIFYRKKEKIEDLAVA